MCDLLLRYHSDLKQLHVRLFLPLICSQKNPHPGQKRRERYGHLYSREVGAWVRFGWAGFVNSDNYVIVQVPYSVEYLPSYLLIINRLTIYMYLPVCSCGGRFGR